MTINDIFNDAKEQALELSKETFKQVKENRQELLKFGEKAGKIAIEKSKEIFKHNNNDYGINEDENEDFSISFEKLFKSLNREQYVLFTKTIEAMDTLYGYFKKENPKIDNKEIEHKIADEINKTLVYSKVKDVVGLPLIDKYKTFYDVFCEMTEQQQFGFNCTMSAKFKDLFKLEMTIIRTYVRPLNKDS